MVGVWCCARVIVVDTAGVCTASTVDEYDILVDGSRINGRVVDDSVSSKIHALNLALFDITV